MIDLDGIRARADDDNRRGVPWNSAIEDRVALLAEVERLKADLAKAATWRDDTGACFMDVRNALQEAGTDPFRTKPDGSNRVAVAVECVRKLGADLAAVRVALAIEKAACDYAAERVGRHEPCRWSSDAGWLNDYRARRAAESKDHLTGVGEMVEGEAMQLIRRVAMAEDWTVAKTARDACRDFLRSADSKAVSKESSDKCSRCGVKTKEYDGCCWPCIRAMDAALDAAQGGG